MKRKGWPPIVLILWTLSALFMLFSGTVVLHAISFPLYVAMSVVLCKVILMSEREAWDRLETLVKWSVWFDLYRDKNVRDYIHNRREEP